MSGTLPENNRDNAWAKNLSLDFRVVPNNVGSGAIRILHDGKEIFGFSLSEPGKKYFLMGMEPSEISINSRVAGRMGAFASIIESDQVMFCKNGDVVFKVGEEKNGFAWKVVVLDGNGLHMEIRDADSNQRLDILSEEDKTMLAKPLRFENRGFIYEFSRGQAKVISTEYPITMQIEHGRLDMMIMHPDSRVATIELTPYRLTLCLEGEGGYVECCQPGQYVKMTPAGDVLEQTKSVPRHYDRKLVDIFEPPTILLEPKFIESSLARHAKIKAGLHGPA